MIIDVRGVGMLINLKRILRKIIAGIAGIEVVGFRNFVLLLV